MMAPAIRVDRITVRVVCERCNSTRHLDLYVGSRHPHTGRLCSCPPADGAHGGLVSGTMLEASPFFPGVFGFVVARVPPEPRE